MVYGTAPGSSKRALLGCLPSSKIRRRRFWIWSGQIFEHQSNFCKSLLISPWSSSIPSRTFPSSSLHYEDLLHLRSLYYPHLYIMPDTPPHLFWPSRIIFSSRASPCPLVDETARCCRRWWARRCLRGRDSCQKWDRDIHF